MGGRGRGKACYVAEDNRLPTTFAAEQADMGPKLRSSFSSALQARIQLLTGTQITLLQARCFPDPLYPLLSPRSSATRFASTPGFKCSSLGAKKKKKRKKQAKQTNM